MSINIKKRKISILTSKAALLLISLCFLGTMLSSCFTGIEGTKTIQLSKGDLKRLRSTPEDTLMSSIRPRRIADLQRGDSLRITDDRISLFADVFSPQGDTILSGRTIAFYGLDSRLTPANAMERLLIFTDGDWSMAYPLGVDPVSADSLPVSRLPMLLDMDMVRQARHVLKGLKVWSRTSLGYDSDGVRRKMPKFAPYYITDVSPSDGVFPLLLKLTPDRPPLATVAGSDSTSLPDRFAYLNFGYGRGESRNFSSQFFLSDPRLRHSDVSDANWTAIMAERVAKGMTKEECRLAIGNPQDVEAGHDYSRLLDVWIYPDGTFLRFVDGLLFDFRQ